MALPDDLQVELALPFIRNEKREFGENAAPLKPIKQTIEHDQVRSDQEKPTLVVGAAFPQRVEVLPDESKSHHEGLS